MDENKKKFADIREMDQNRYKINLTTTLEDFFFNIFSLSLVITVILSIIIFVRKNEIEYLSEITIGFLIVTLISWVFFKLTDNYYILDMNEGKIHYRFSFIFIEKLFLKALTSDIKALSTDCRLVVRRGGTQYKYSIILITNSGEKIRISDWTNLFGTDEYDSFINEARELAENLKFPFIPGKAEHLIVPEKTGSSQCEITYKKWNVWTETFKNMVFALVSVVAVLAFTAWIISHYIR